LFGGCARQPLFGPRWQQTKALFDQAAKNLGFAFLPAFLTPLLEFPP
jgi:hypothetical protein